MLCSKKRLGLLASLPYAGLLAEAVEVLLELARRANVLERPNHYEILYGFLIQRGDYTTGIDCLNPFN